MLDTFNKSFLIKNLFVQLEYIAIVGFVRELSFTIKGTLVEEEISIKKYLFQYLHISESIKPIVIM